jgi:mannose-1-phosphate guanylyltransferase
MKAMILAAGFGTRIRPLSDRCPKPLLPVLGRPLIDYALEHLTHAGITRIGANVHHGAEQVQEHLRNHAPEGVRIAISPEQEILGTGGGIGAMREFLGDEGPFVVYNGDVLSRIDLGALLAAHSRHSPLVTMVLWDDAAKNSVTLSPEGVVCDFSGRLGAFRPGKNQLLTFTGISMVDPQVLDLIPPRGPSNIIDVYLALIERTPGAIRGYAVQGPYWRDVGTPHAYLQVHEELLRGDKGVLFLPGHPESCYQGAGSQIERGASWEGFLALGSNCVVRADTFLKNCVVWDNTIVKKGMHLENGVIDGNWHYALPG